MQNPLEGFAGCIDEGFAAAVQADAVFQPRVLERCFGDNAAIGPISIDDIRAVWEHLARIDRRERALIERAAEGDGAVSWLCRWQSRLGDRSGRRYHRRRRERGWIDRQSQRGNRCRW